MPTTLLLAPPLDFHIFLRPWVPVIINDRTLSSLLDGSSKNQQKEFDQQHSTFLSPRQSESLAVKQQRSSNLLHI